MELILILREVLSPLESLKLSVDGQVHFAHVETVLVFQNVLEVLLLKQNLACVLLIFDSQIRTNRVSHRIGFVQVGGGNIRSRFEGPHP